jgi:hypothetical protein
MSTAECVPTTAESDVLLMDIVGFCAVFIHRLRGLERSNAGDDDSHRLALAAGSIEMHLVAAARAARPCLIDGISVH